MTIEQALKLSGTYICLMVDWGDEDGPYRIEGHVLGVCVPAPGSPVKAHLLLKGPADRSDVSPCGGGFEVFLHNVRLWAPSSPKV